MHEVLDALGPARAVVFDVDGTLYAQRPVRRAMALRLARAHLRSPMVGARTLRTLAAYRRAQETLRDEAFEGDVAVRQLELAAAARRVDVDDVASLVELWMEAAPLEAVAANRQAGLVELLDELSRRDVALAVVSDYPAQRKLAALGLDGRFATVVTAQDPRVRAFKPNPRGILVALDELGVAADDALYVGDRPEVDAAAAAAAGVRCVLVGRRTGGTNPDRNPVASAATVAAREAT